MRLYKTTKKVLSVTPCPKAFLNGLTTNSLDKPQNAFVNIHGRIIATFDQVQANDEKFLLVIEAAFLSAVLSHLERFARLSKTVLKEENLFVYFDLEGSYRPSPTEFVIAQKCGQLVLTANNLPSAVSDEEFTRFRLQNNIPLLGVDYKDEMLLNVSAEDFVSFTKGCFLGQEPLAKVHHRSKPTWKLVVKCEEQCLPEEKEKMTSRAVDPLSGKVSGFVFVANK